MIDTDDSDAPNNLKERPQRTYRNAAWPHSYLLTTTARERDSYELPLPSPSTDDDDAEEDNMMAKRITVMEQGLLMRIAVMGAQSEWWRRYSSNEHVALLPLHLSFVRSLHCNTLSPVE
jgi:hypothetical protein